MSVTMSQFLLQSWCAYMRKKANHTEAMFEEKEAQGKFCSQWVSETEEKSVRGSLQLHGNIVSKEHSR